MAHTLSHSETLKAEARLLTIAGFILLAIGLPVTLFVAAQVLHAQGLSPALPAMIGGPPLLLGYLACHFASARMARAKALEAQR